MNLQQIQQAGPGCDIQGDLELYVESFDKVVGGAHAKIKVRDESGVTVPAIVFGTTAVQVGTWYRATNMMTPGKGPSIRWQAKDNYPPELKIAGQFFTPSPMQAGGAPVPAGPPQAAPQAAPPAPRPAPPQPAPNPNLPDEAKFIAWLDAMTALARDRLTVLEDVSKEVQATASKEAAVTFWIAAQKGEARLTLGPFGKQEPTEQPLLDGGSLPPAESYDDVSW